MRGRSEWAARSRAAVGMAAALLLAACAAQEPDPVGGPVGEPLGDLAGEPLAEPVLSPQPSGTPALLQAVSTVDDRTVWVSGHDGVVLRTLDGGTAWTPVPTPVLDSLQFRDVHAFSAAEAALLTAGSGNASRIYHTADAGVTWSLAYLMEDDRGFLDCLDFWDDRGIAYGDSFDGVPFVLRTSDRGRTWARLGPVGLPPALEGEGGFAASGTCARAGPEGVGWIATGAGGAARVLRSDDYGATWHAADVPVVRGDAAGLTTLSFAGDTGLALGGDLAQMDAPTANAARSSDGGRTWTASPPPRMVGPVYGSGRVPGTRAVVVAGPAGADWSPDMGLAWAALDSVSFWAVGFASPAAGWMVGPDGRITKVAFRR